MRKWLPWLLLAVVLVVALVIGATRTTGPRTPAERVQHITGQLRCPLCQGETVADSNALISRDIRALVQDRVAAGQSDRQIIAYVVQHYPGTLLKPPASGLGLIVWALPVVVVVAAIGGLGMAFLRWRGRTGITVTDADRAIVDRALVDRASVDQALVDRASSERRRQQPQ
jgi:cytochrome c-type biogenesis protein CcmH